MHPRRITECVDAFKALDADKAWLSGYTEKQLCDVVPKVIEETDYDNYLMVSDDFLVSQEAFDAVTSLLEQGHPVVTGYANLAFDNPLVNITKSPVQLTQKGTYYHWYTELEACNYESDVIPT